MFIKLTEKRNGKTSVRIVESLRKDKKIQQKTIMSLGCAEKEDNLEILKETARKMLVKLSNERKPALPGMEEIVYGKSEQSNFKYLGRRALKIKKPWSKPLITQRGGAHDSTQIYYKAIEAVTIKSDLD